MKLIFETMKDTATQIERFRVRGIEANYNKHQSEKYLEELVRENQNLPEQKKCPHGGYSTIGNLRNVCTFCFWWDKNPGLDW